jgi:histidinol-phosphate aminotransferase
MGKNVGEWVRRKLEMMGITPYLFGDSVESVQQRFGVERSKIVKLDSNENFFIPREKLLKLVVEALENLDLRLYPQEEKQELRDKLSSYAGVPPNYIVIGNGGDELIERIVCLFLEDGEQALTISPTYSMYRRAVIVQRAKLQEVSLKEDFSLDVNSLVSCMTAKSKVLFLCSPNNPTANQFKMDDVKTLIENFPGMVIVDETYFEFADYSVASLIQKYENLIVLRTFSKAFGLAGLRLGYCIADAEVAKALSDNVGLPYPVNTLSLKVGVKVLENIHIVKEAVKQVKIEREKLVKALNDIDGVKAFDSKTNFILFKTKRSSAKVYYNLLKRGVIVKKIGAVLNLQNCFRTAVGLPWMIERLVEALRETCSRSGG